MFKQWLSGPVIALVLLTPLPSLASPAATGQPGPRPQISDYQDQQTFVKALLAWQRRMAQWQPGESDTAPPPLRDDQKDWHRVTGPEDLDTAVSNAAGYQQPRYREAKRFDRTTHVSFPLAPLPQELLADQVVETTTATDNRNLLPALPDPLQELDSPSLELTDSPISFTPPERREVSTRMR